MPDFVWDPDKARTNLAKHDVAFEDAVLVSSDPLYQVRQDRDGSSEPRWHAIGLVGSAIPLIVVHTYRGWHDGQIRVISARKATRKERRDDGDGCFQGAT